MVNAKISRHSMFSGPSPSNGMHDKYKYATINTQNITLSKNITAENVNATNVNTSKINVNNIIANALKSNQVVPSDNNINLLDIGQNISFNISDKYYYKDQCPRSRCDITDMNKDIYLSLQHPNHVNIEISTGKTFRLKNNQETNHIDSNFSNYPRTRLSVPPYNINLYYVNILKNYCNYDISENTIAFSDTSSNFLIEVDASNIPLSNSWGPKILNQGHLGDCYAFAASTCICYSYMRYLKYNLQMDATDSEFAKIANYMLPSMIYIEKLYNKVSSTYQAQMNPFQQGGVNLYAMYNYLIQDSNILEFQYSYPLFLTTYASFFTMSDDTKNYLINEYVDKVINDTPNDILAVAKSQNYYKKVFDPSNNSIVDISFNFHFMLKEDTIFNDNSFNSTWLSTDGSGTDLNNYYNIILNNVISTIDNNYALSVEFYIAKENALLNNGTEFNTPTSIADIEGAHAVTIVGYNNAISKFIIQNSWGYNTGINNSGYFYLPYDMIKFILKTRVDIFKYSWLYVKFS